MTKSGTIRKRSSDLRFVLATILKFNDLHWKISRVITSLIFLRYLTMFDGYSMVIEGTMLFTRYIASLRRSYSLPFPLAKKTILSFVTY